MGVRSGRTLFRDGAIADGRSPFLRRGLSILVEDFFCAHGDPLSDPAALWRVWRTGWESAPGA